MGYYEENRKLYPLKAGDVLECVESGTPWFLKRVCYTVDDKGQVPDEEGTPWFTNSRDVPTQTLFKLKSSAPQWVEGQPPEEVPEGKQVVLGYKLVEKPTLEVGKVYTDLRGYKWKAICENGKGVLMAKEGAPLAYEWSYEGEPNWMKNEDYIIDFSVPPQDDY